MKIKTTNLVPVDRMAVSGSPPVDLLWRQRQFNYLDRNDAELGQKPNLFDCIGETVQNIPGITHGCHGNENIEMSKKQTFDIYFLTARSKKSDFEPRNVQISEHTLGFGNVD